MGDMFEEDHAYAVFEQIGRTAGNATWLHGVEQIVVYTAEQLRMMVSDLALAPFVTFDVETTGLSIVDDKLVALQFCGRPDRAYFVPIAMMGVTNLSIAEVVVTCQPLWHRGLIGHNVGFDWQFMQRWVDMVIEADTLLESKLVPELWEKFEQGWSLKNVSSKLFDRPTIDYKALFPKGTKKGAMRFDILPMSVAVPYACQDVVLTWLLHDYLLQSCRLDRSSFVYQLEHRIIKPFARMELLGVGLNVEQVVRAQGEAQQLMAEQLREIEAIAGRPINLNATKEMSWLLYDHCRLPVLSRTAKGGVPSTDKATLEKLRGSHPIIDTILHYRATAKLEQAFLGTLPGMVASDGCIHTSYNQYGAISGRVSARNPNLQQVPKERGKDADEFRRAIRSAFVPPTGFVGFLDIDYSQIEYRLFASLSGDRGLIEAFLSGVDVHEQTASIMLGVPLDQVDKNLRNRGKTLNFAAIYGQGPKALAATLGMSVGEATALQEQYWQKMPVAAAYCERLRQDARNSGYASTYFGRRRCVPNINSSNRWERMQDERYAVNSPVQGTAADIMKMAIARLDATLGEFKSRMCLNVHDQIVIAHHPDDNLDHLAEASREAMEMDNLFPWPVPLVTEPGYGPNWNDIEDFKYPSRRPAPPPVMVEVPVAVVSAPAIALAPSAALAQVVAPAPTVPAAPSILDDLGGDYLQITVPDGLPKEKIQMVRSLLAVRRGETPVVLAFRGDLTRTAFRVTVQPKLLFDLRRYGVGVALGAATQAAVRQAVAGVAPLAPGVPA